ncbi:Dual specificity protein phosphatase 12 [Termitomyces sp. J132]|nr:Dual specificity protein phosphatase 12 [Termitomyces sp. J132]
MDEVTPGLWIGDLASALNVEKLRTHGIYSILSAMRGRLTIQETFIQHQVLLDDTEDTDILQHLLPSIHFIEAELNKGRGVLVHCHAGVSRSASLIAAYLMYSKRLDRETALEMIRNVRPSIEPNEGFLRQLEIFHQAQYKISRRDKTTRLYYMERAYDEVMNGDGSLPEIDMFAKYPSTPSDSTPNTPGYPRRRIRCKMCRQELATREHMLDHGQLGSATPAARTPAGSRRPSTSARGLQPSNSLRWSGGMSSGAAEPRPRRASILGGLGDSLTMSSISNESSGVGAIPMSRRSSNDKLLRNLPEIPHAQDGRSSSALESDDEEPNVASELAASPTDVAGGPVEISHETAKFIGRRMSDALLSPTGEPKESPLDTLGKLKHTLSDSQVPSQTSEKSLPTTLISPSELAAELMTNPKLAALRAPHPGSQSTGVTQPHTVAKAPPQSPPILMNPKCSGYFVEPMKWMEPFLSAGELAGKIVCPNSKCSAKLGNYDWAGVCCGCKAWVIPGFCINRSKVDEIVK